MICYTRKWKIPFLVDDECVDKISSLPWRINTGGYVVTGVKSIRLYIFLFGYAPLGLYWNHINREKLDNRRCNLRYVTQSGNNQNQNLRKDNPTGHVGIGCYYNGWLAYIHVNKQYIRLGTFHTLEEALFARKEAERKYNWNQNGEETEPGTKSL